MDNFEERVTDSFAKQPFMSTIGANLATVRRGFVEIRLPFSSNLTQQNGFLHAGAITAILDSACGYAALSVAGPDADVLTVEFKVNLLSPATGEDFLARAGVKKAGKTLTVCSGCVRGQGWRGEGRSDDVGNSDCAVTFEGASRVISNAADFRKMRSVYAPS